MSSIQKNGVTLIEVSVSTLLVATMLLTSITASSNLMRTNRESSNSTLGQELCQRFLDEITSQFFDDPQSSGTFGVESGENLSNRQTLDDVDDYHGYQSSSLTYRNGSAMPDSQGWSVAIIVDRCEAITAGIQLSNSNVSGLRRIQVTCTSLNGQQVTSCALVSNAPTNLQRNTRYHQFRQVNILPKNGQPPVQVIVPLRNHPTSGGS